MHIVIDGIDGTGKTTLVEFLKTKFPQHNFHDRGLPTKLTDDPNAKDYYKNEDVIYIILDDNPDMCRKRLKNAGKDLNEEYHTFDSLKEYRQKFKDVFYSLSNYRKVYFVNVYDNKENMCQFITELIEENTCPEEIIMDNYEIVEYEEDDEDY